jgi:hypothetical protein
MAQQKGNPTPSYQNEAYEALYANTNARENRDYGTTPVMLSSDTNLEEVLTGTEFTEVHEFTGSLSLSSLPGGNNDSPLTIYPFISGYKFETTKAIHIIPNSQDNSITGYYVAVSGSTMIGSDYRHTHIITGSVILAMGNYANDTAAAAAGVVLGAMYHTNGTVKVRLT